MKKQLLLMLLALLPLMASADDSGSCGTNVTYTYVESSRTLTISGNGAMDDYYWDNTPWNSYKAEIVKAVIENGVTSIECFQWLSKNHRHILLCREYAVNGIYVFNNSYVEKATLHVPASALEAYKTTMPWSMFGTFVSFEDEAVDISTIADSNRASGQVYNLQGLRLSRTQRGLYIRDGKKYVVK